MSGFEWFLLVVVVIAVPLVVAVAVTLWTLEQARMRNRKHRETADVDAPPSKRRATRDGATTEVVTGTPLDDTGGETAAHGLATDPTGRVSRET